MSQPDPEFIAKQLRKPTGEFAGKIGKNMNRVNEALFDLTLGEMQPKDGESILEIGFGTGKFFEKLLSAARNLRVYGIDFSDKMVETAKGNNPSDIASGNLMVKWGQSDDIPYPDQSFDKVFCNMVIYFWEQPEKHLSEIHRVLKPGGTFYTGFRTKESMHYFPFVKNGFVLYEVDEWQEILKDNGFSLLHSRASTDPAIEVKGKKVRLESYCITAKKE